MQPSIFCMNLDTFSKIHVVCEVSINKCSFNCPTSRYKLQYKWRRTGLKIHINIILVIILMQDIYNYIPEAIHVSRVYSVAAVLYSQFMVHVMLFRL